MAEDLIRFRIVLDDAGVPAAATRAETSLARVNKVVDQSSIAMLKFGQNGQVTAQQLQALSYQTTDIVTQLAGGQSPFLVLLQQGGQLRDQFGGLGNVFKAVGNFAFSAKGGLLLLGAAAAGAAYEAFQSYKSYDQLNKTLALTNNASGLTRDSFQTAAKSIAQSTQSTTGEAKSILQQLLSTGAFTADTLDDAGAAVVGFQRLTGQSTEDVVKDLASMRGNVTEWATAHNRAYQYTTTSQIQYIRNLEAQGRGQDAMRETLRLWSQAVQERSKEAMSALDLLTLKFKESSDIQSTWIGKWFTPPTAKSVVQQLTDEIEYLQKLNPAKGTYSAARLGLLQEQREGAGELYRLQNRSAAASLLNAQNSERASFLNSPAYVQSRLAIESASASSALATEEASFAKRRLIADRGYELLAMSSQRYSEVLIAIEKDRIDAEEGAVLKQLSIESRRIASNEIEANQKKAAQIALAARLAEFDARRMKLKLDVERGEFDRAPLGLVNTVRDRFNLSEKAGYGALDAGLAAQKLQRQDAARELLQLNRQLGIQLIQDDRRRGQAQIDEEERQLRERLDLESRNAEERKQIEDQLAIWRVNREKQLTNELKPEWQRKLELWEDTQRGMQQATNTFLDGWQNKGRDVFVNFATTGKLSISSLVQYAQQQFAQTFFDRFLMKAFTGVGESLWGSLWGSGSGFPVLDTSGIGINMPDALRGGAAGGTNYLERDMLTIIHKGEAVIPKAYNPAAGGLGGGGGVTIHQTFNVASGADRNALIAAAQAGKQAAVAEILQLHKRGNPAVT